MAQSFEKVKCSKKDFDLVYEGNKMRVDSEENRVMVLRNLASLRKFKV